MAASANKADASGLSLGVYPPIIQITAAPPADIITPITISNLSDQSITLNIGFKPFTASEKENGEVSYLSGDQLSGADPLMFQRIQIRDDDGDDINTVSLAPYQQEKLNLHIGIPEDEPLSDYYFSIIFSSQADDLTTLDNNQSQNAAGIATNVLLSIGQGETKGNLVEFSAPLFTEKGPIPFTVRVQNTGAHYITPQGTITVVNMFGQTIGKIDLLPVNILANTIRAIPDSLQSPDANPPASVINEVNVLGPDSPKAIWPEIFILGPYKATLSIALSPQGPLFKKTIYFIGFPIELLIIIIVSTLIILLIRNRLKHHIS